MNITTKLIIIYLILLIIGMSCETQIPNNKEEDKCKLALIYISSCALDVEGYVISVQNWNSICDKKVAEEILQLTCDKIVLEYIK